MQNQDMTLNDDIHQDKNLDSAQPAESEEPARQVSNEDYISIGEYLRAARDDKEFSLKKISHNTKISVTILENLESDNLAALPNKAYVNGFIKSLCQVLELDQDEALNVLEQTYRRHGGNPTPEGPIDKLTRQELESPNYKLWIASGVGLLLIVLLVVVLKGIDSPSHNKPVVIESQSLDATTPLKQVGESTKLAAPKAAAPKPIDASDVQVKAAPTPAKTVVVEIDAVKAAEEAEQEDEPQAKTEVTEAKTEQIEDANEETEETTEDDKKEIQLRPISGPLYSIDTQTSQEEKEKYLPPHIRESMFPNKQNVFISAAEGDTWITYKKDSDPVKKFVLRKGRTLLIRGDEIRLFFGNINVAKVYLNGNLIDAPSRSGVKSLVFPIAKQSKFKLPLFIYKKDGTVEPSDEWERNQAPPI